MRADVESAKQEVDDATMTLVKVKADSAALSNSLVSQQVSFTLSLGRTGLSNGLQPL